jgi:hypothetical protein
MLLTAPISTQNLKHQEVLFYPSASSVEGLAVPKD